MRLHPMTAEEYPRFREDVVTGFAADQVAAGNWTAETALARSAASFDELLPAGAGTPDQLLLTAEDGGGEVGFLWLALRHPRDVADTAWINDISVRADRRGQGLGRQLLAAAEQVVIDHGLGALALNTIGPNTVARRLYESSGYRITTLQMSKPLRPAVQPVEPAPATPDTPDPDWEQRVAALWTTLDDQDPAGFRAQVEALGSERPPGDAAATFELACANDSTGRPDVAIGLYRSALAAGLTGIRRRRAVIQQASSLRATGQPDQAVDLLTTERATTSDELDDAVTAFLALALADVGRADEAAGLALIALAPHLPRYQRSLAAYAADLTPPNIVRSRSLSVAIHDKFSPCEARPLKERPASQL